MTRRALILGCDERAGLAVIRSLGRAGIEVDVAWPESPSATASRYVRTVFDLPDPKEPASRWLERLTDILGRHQYDLVIPCTDHAVIPIQQNKAREA